VTQPKTKRPSLMRSSMIFAGLTLVSRFMGFARDVVVTRAVGATATIAGDAYATALTFPNLFRRIFAEGAFAAAFVPAYSKRLGADEKDADRFAADALATVAMASVILTTVCMLAMPWIMRVYNAGYLDDPAKFRLTWMLTIVTMPYLPCMVIASVFSGILNARGRFIVSGAYPTLLNLIMLVIIWPQTDPISAAWAGAIAVIIAGVAQAALCWWGASKSGATIRFVLPRLTPEMKVLLKAAVPAVIANSATQVNIVIAGILASQVDGMRAWMSVADRLYQLPWSLVGVAIGIALLPRLSQAIQAKDSDDAQAAMDQALVFSMALSLPAAAALIVLPAHLIDGLFGYGLFTSHDAAQTGLLLLHYGWGVPAFVLQRILQPAFFARGDTRTPMNYSLISVAVNIVLAVTLFYKLGFYGVAIATSAAAWISVIQMALALMRRGDYRPSAKAVSKVARVILAVAGMAGVLLAMKSFHADLMAAASALGGAAKLIVIVLICMAGGALYPVFLFAFGGVTPAEFRAALKRKKNDPPPAPLP